MATNLKPIILYDLDSTNEKRAWSLNTWKTRFILNYKGLPYQTHWLEYPDIKPYFISIGMEHSVIGRKTGNIYYLVPALTDPNKLTPDGKPTMLAGSWKIAEYLEETYPEYEGSKSLFPNGTKQLQRFFADTIEDTEFMTKEPIHELIVRRTHGRLKPASQEHFRTTREKNFGCKLEELCPEGEVRTAALEGTKAGFDKMNSLFPEQEQDQALFTLTNQICYADFVLASTLMWMRENAPEELWCHIRTWNEGRYERFLNALEERYGQVN